MTRDETVAELLKLEGNPEIMFEYRMKTGYDEGTIYYATIDKVEPVSARLNNVLDTIGLIKPSRYIEVGGW